jgi:hypothetical protein
MLAVKKLEMPTGNVTWICSHAIFMGRVEEKAAALNIRRFDPEKDQGPEAALL